MKKTARMAAIAVALSVLGLTFAGRTLSYLSGRQEITNTFTVGDLELGLKESEWEPEKGDGVSAVPGSSVYKNPTIKNVTSSKNGEQPCYARMIVKILDESGNIITDQVRLSLIKTMLRYDAGYTGTYDAKGTGTAIQEGRIPGYSLEKIEELPMLNPVFELDEERSSDGVLVCNYNGRDGTGLLRNGDWAALFTVLAVPTEWTKSEVDTVGDFQIRVSAEAIQSAGFADRRSAYQALDAEVEAYGQ
ncbi:MAG: hypothetical protein Q4C50_05880 [Eubacteriales bacterium]|nr:hypothetical protein [Eubacteriales bacterium]